MASSMVAVSLAVSLVSVAVAAALSVMVLFGGALVWYLIPVERSERQTMGRRRRQQRQDRREAHNDK